MTRRELVLNTCQSAVAEHLDRDFDFLDVGVGDADGFDLAFVAEGGEVGDDVGVAHRSIGTVPLVEVDHLDLQRTQRLLDRCPQVVQGAVATPLLALAAGDTALGGDHHGVRVAAIGPDGVPDDALVVADRVPGRRVDVAGVDKGDAGVEGGMDRVDPGLLVRIALVVVHRHRHGAEADRGHGERAERAGLHALEVIDEPPGARSGLRRCRCRAAHCARPGRRNEGEWHGLATATVLAGE